MKFHEREHCGWFRRSLICTRERIEGESIDKKEKERRIPSVGTFTPTLYPYLYRKRKKERGRFIAILAYCRKPAVVLFCSLCLWNRFYRTFPCTQRIHRPFSFLLHLYNYMTSFFIIIERNKNSYLSLIENEYSKIMILKCCIYNKCFYILWNNLIYLFNFV